MDPSAQPRGGDTIFVLLGLYFAGHLAYIAWTLFKSRHDITHDFGEMRASWRQTRADFAKLRGAYRSERASGLDRVEAFAAAADDVSGKKASPRIDIPPAPPPVPLSNTARGLAILYAVLINAVSIAGVYVIDWPVATGLALYWAENMLTGVLLLIAIALWRATHASTREDARGPSLGEVTTITVVFNGAHLLFLVLFLGVMLPRIDPLQAFDRPSFVQGLALIATLLALEFLPGIARIRRAPAGELQRGVMYYLQRVVVVHLAIIFGMFALLLFGTPRTFFAVFAGLKMVADISRRLAR